MDARSCRAARLWILPCLDIGRRSWAESGDQSMKPVTFLRTSWMRAAMVALVLAVAGLGALTFDQWLPPLRKLVQSASSVDHANHDADHGHGEDGDHGHSHVHEGHDEANSVELSTQAQKNIELKTAKISLQR